MRKEVLGGLGGFGGMFRSIKICIRRTCISIWNRWRGNEIDARFMADKHDTIGIDAVAMCVNDIVVQGAEPLFFLDYIACGKAEPSKIENIVSCISEGCRQAGCALIGGETAEMPGMYSTEEYDLAGFTVGIVDKKKIVTGEKIEAGHVLIGLASSGIHSNGYSLVRKVLLEDGELSLERIYGRLELPLGEELLKPTKIYVKPILELLKKHEVYGMAHITGGGFIENIPRMLPEGIGAEIELGPWEIQPSLVCFQEVGKLEEKEMFNILTWVLV